MSWYLWVILVAVFVIAFAALFVAKRMSARSGSVLATADRSDRPR